MDTTPADMGRHLSALSFNSEGGLLLAASSMTYRYWNGSVWYYTDPEAAPDIIKCTTGVETESGVVDAKWMPNSNTIVAGCDSGAIIAWTFKADSPRFELVRSNSSHDNYVTSVSFPALDDSNIPLCISTSQDKTIRVWDLNTVSEVSVHKGHYGAITAGASHGSNPNLFASCGLDGWVITWDFRIQRPARIIETPLTSLPTALTWQPGYDSRLVVGTESGDIAFTDITDSSQSHQRVPGVHTRAINRIAFSLTRTDWLATASSDCSVSVTKIEANGGRVVYRDTRHKDFVHGLAWHPKDNRLFSCGYDTLVLPHNVVECEGLASPLAGISISCDKEKTEKMEINGEIPS